MAPRLVHWGSLILVLLAAALGLLAAGWLIEAHGFPVPLALGLALAFVALAAALVWLLQELAWLRPLRSLTREVQLLVHADAGRRPVPPGWHALGSLPDALEALAERARELGGRQDRAVAEAGARAYEQRTRLEAVLQGLGDGVIGCSPDRRILLFNDAARRILRATADLGLDRPLDRLIASEPVRHVYGILLRQEAGAAATASPPFVAATVEGAKLLRCRMGLIRDQAGARGFILNFVDATEQFGGAAGRAGEVMRRVRALRGPAAGLLAAAEVLADPALEDADRRRFGEVAEREGAALSERIGALDEAALALADSAWPRADLLSTDLALQVAHRLADRASPITLEPVGLGVWLHGDVVHLAMLIEQLVVEAGAGTGADAFDLDAARADGRVRLDLIFRGPPVAPATLDGWLERPLPGPAGADLLRDVLDRHHGEIWSQRHERPGESVLRLLLPAARRPEAPAAEALPPRPEFYDFDLLAPADAAGDLLDRPLAGLTYVVFDTETTGLDPAGADQIIQIAAVRIVNRRLLSGETFDRLVDPGRSIPKASIRFHGITEAMVRGRPPIEVVLPQFHAFAEGAVLVAHNAAFDLAFLRKAEARAGVRFTQPVLDTLLLSVMLHDHTDEHGLDAIAERFGITLEDRHQALGDALGTAQVFLRMLGLLEAQGVRTLADALTLSGRAVAVRKQQARAFGGAPRRGAAVAGTG